MAPPRRSLDVDLVKRLIAEGQGVKAIGRATGLAPAIIRSRLREWKLKTNIAWRPWSVEEDEVLLLTSHVLDDEEIGRALNRTEKGVAYRRREMEMLLPNHAENPWRSEEEAIVRENFPKRPVEEFLELLPGRNRSQTEAKAERMRLTAPGRPPFEIVELNRLINRLKRKINERESEHH